MARTSQVVVRTNTGHFSEENFSRLKEIMYFESYQKGACVFWEGEVNNSIYFLFDGKIKLTKINEFGKDLTLAVYFPGDLFGEYDTSMQQKNSYTAETIQSSEVGMIKQNELNVLLKENPEFAVEFSQWQSQVQRYTQLKLRDLLLYGKNGALASTLLRAANTYGVEQDDAIIISEKFTNYDLANLIGATRETVNRLLSGFEKDGLIKNRHGRITIMDLPSLKDINRCEDCPVEICRL